MGADRDTRQTAAQLVALGVGAGVLVLEAEGLWRSGYGLGGEVIVRCRDGHLFSTLWIPGASVKALRLGLVARSALPRRPALVARFTRSPVTPSAPAQIAAAEVVHDVRLP